MANFIIVDTPDAPLPGDHKAVEVYSVTAADAATAVSQLAAANHITEPRTWYVARAVDFVKYTSTTTCTVNSVPV